LKVNALARNALEILQLADQVSASGVLVDLQEALIRGLAVG
jgi:hypothetical protein